MPSRTFVRAGSATALALALISPAGGAIAQEGETITLLAPSWGVPPDADLLAAFEEESGIDVEIIGEAGVDVNKLFTDVTTALGTGQPAADVIFLTEEAPSNIVATGAVEDISDLVEANGLDVDAFESWDLWRDGDAVYGIPVYSQLVMFDYDTAKLAEAGFEPPTTWDELTDQARAIKEQGIDDHPISAPPGDWSWFLMARAGGEPMFDEDLNPVFADEGSQAREAMARLLTWGTEELLSPSLISGEISNHDNWWAGNAVFHQGWQGSVVVGNNPDISAHAPNVEYLLLPEDGATWSFPAAVGIGAGSENRDAAWEFIEWYTDDGNLRAIFDRFGLYPARPALAAELNDEGRIEGYDVIVEQAKTLDELPRQALWWGPWTTAVDEAVLRAIQEGTSADEVVDDLAAEWEELREIYS